MDSGRVQKKLKEKWEENSSIVNISQSNIKNEQLSCSCCLSAVLFLPSSPRFMAHAGGCKIFQETIQITPPTEQRTMSVSA